MTTPVVNGSDDSGAYGGCGDWRLRGPRAWGITCPGKECQFQRGGTVSCWMPGWLFPVGWGTRQYPGCQARFHLWSFLALLCCVAVIIPPTSTPSCLLFLMQGALLVICKVESYHLNSALKASLHQASLSILSLLMGSNMGTSLCCLLVGMSTAHAVHPTPGLAQFPLLVGYPLPPAFQTRLFRLTCNFTCTRNLHCRLNSAL